VPPVLIAFGNNGWPEAESGILFTQLFRSDYESAGTV
jgi:hypothetical protein